MLTSEQNPWKNTRPHRLCLRETAAQRQQHSWRGEMQTASGNLLEPKLLCQQHTRSWVMGMTDVKHTAGGSCPCWPGSPCWLSPVCAGL